MYRYLLTRRRIIFFLVILGIVCGFFSLSLMQIKLYPDIAKPVIQVSIPHPSFTAVDFMDNYKTTINDLINTIEGVERVEITSNNGRTTIRLDFEYGLSAEEQKNEVSSSFDTIKNQLPEESRNFTVRYWSQTVSELDFALFSSEFDERELYETAKPVIMEFLGKLQDAEDVSVLSIEELRANLTFDHEALFSYGLSADGVVSAIKSGYKNISVGTLRTPAGSYSLRVRKDIDTLFDLRNIIISYSNGKTIYLRDVADVAIDYGFPRTAYRVDGNRSVIIYIEPKVDGNLNRLSQDAHAAMKLAMKELPDHVRYVTVLDPATFINRSVRNVVQSAVIGALLAVFCIILLIGEARNSLIITVSLPISVVLAFILMKVFGVSINLISLSGLALAVGMIVDASIVVMENIYRHREDDLRANGRVKSYVDLISGATKEVIPSIIGSVLTSVCVFIPLSFTSPLTSSILGDLANTVVFTLLCSLVVALFVVPLIAFYIFRRRKTDSRAGETVMQRFSNALVKKLLRGYESLLLPLLSKKRRGVVFIVFSLAALLASFIFLFPKITREIIAPPQSNILQVYFSHSEITDQEELSAAIAPLEYDLLHNYPGIVKMVFVSVTRYSRGGMVVTLDSAKSLSGMVNTLSKKFESIDPWTYTFTSWDPAAMPLPQTYALHVRVEGPDRKQIFAMEDRLVDILRQSDFYGSIRTSPFTTLSNEIALYPRPQAFGAIPEYSVNRLVSFIQYLLNGALVVKMSIEDDEMDIYLKYPDKTINSIKDIQDHLVPYNGKSIPVKHFFDFEETTGINQLYFVDGKETFNVYASLKLGEPSWKQAGYENQIRELVRSQIEVPPGYRIIFEDTQKVINDAITSLVGAIALSIVLIYIVLGIQFNSLRIPLVILITIPFGFIGVILSLFVFKSTISLNSMLGVILLGGIVVNNAIIIIDFYLKARPSCATRREAILQSVRLRFRPILITTATTILGMLPIAFAIGDGSNIIQPLGIAVSGGLAFSTFFTLFMVPVILNFFEIRKKDED